MIVDRTVDTRGVANGRRNAIDRADKRTQQVNRMRPHIHKRPTARQVGIAKPGQVFRVKPVSVGCVMGIAKARVRDLPQCPAVYHSFNALHNPVKRLKIAHVNNRIMRSNKR